MFARILKSAAIAVAALGLSAGANAATIFNYSFSVPWSFLSGGGTATGSGQLFTNANGDGTYTVYDVVGTAKATSGSSTATLDATNQYGFAAPTITGTVASGFSLNAIQLTGTDTYNFSKNLFDANYGVSEALRGSSAGTFTLSQVPIAAVPEIGTWMMMVLGFGVIGATLRAGKRSTTIQHVR